VREDAEGLSNTDRRQRMRFQAESVQLRWYHPRHLKGRSFFNPIDHSNDLVAPYYQDKIQSWFSDPKGEAARQD
jgi:hypothetical protein